jgi:hypothetical protein
MSEFGNENNVRAVPAQIEPVLIDAISAAKLLSISTKTLWLRTKSGEIPAKKIGGRVLYSLQKLREFANSNGSDAA